MNSLTVSYRFSRTELSALVQAMHVGMLPGAPLKPVEPELADGILKRLADDGMLMLVDGTLYMDKLIDYLLRAAIGASSTVALTDESRTVLLWKGDQILLLGDFTDPERCSLTPLQNEKDAQSALADAVLQIPAPLRGSNLSAPERCVSIPSDSKLSASEIARAVLDLL